LATMGSPPPTSGRGGTVILSSHLLGEVQATVDRLVVIGGGRIVANGSLEELLTSSGTLDRGLDPIGLNEALSAAGLQLEWLHDGALRGRRHRRAGRPRSRHSRPDRPRCCPTDRADHLHAVAARIRVQLAKFVAPSC
jgi:hypothetical protein